MNLMGTTLDELNHAENKVVGTVKPRFATVTRDPALMIPAIGRGAFTHAHRLR